MFNWTQRVTNLKCTFLRHLELLFNNSLGKIGIYGVKWCLKGIYIFTKTRSKVYSLNKFDATFNFKNLRLSGVKKSKKSQSSETFKALSPV